MTLLSSRIFSTLLFIVFITFVWIMLDSNFLYSKQFGFGFPIYQIQQAHRGTANLPPPAPVNWNGSEIFSYQTQEKPHRHESSQGNITDLDGTPPKDSASKISETEILSEVVIGSWFRARRNRVREVCGRNKDLQHNIKAMKFRSIFYSQKYNLMVCAAPKVGSTTWIMSMLLMRGLHPNVTNLHTKKWLSLVRARNVLGKEATWRMQSSATTFMSVRHPLERLNSAFKSKFANGGPLDKQLKPGFYRVYWKPALMMLNKNLNVVQYITFSEFLQYAMTRPSNAHWRPMHYMCSPCAIDYEYFVRLETFREEMNYLSHLLSNPVLSIQVHRNRKSNTTERLQHGMHHTKDHIHLHNATLLLYRQVPRKLLAMVLRTHHLDLDLFGYQVPEELMRRAGLTHGFKE